MCAYGTDQATNEVVSRVPKCTQEEMNEAVASAQHAYKDWKETTPLTRQRKMLDLQLLIRDNSVSILFLLPPRLVNVNP